MPTLFDIYDAAYDDANDTTFDSAEYIESYSANGMGLYLTDEQVNKILACRIAWLNCEDKNSCNFFHLVENELDDVVTEP